MKITDEMWMWIFSPDCGSVLLENFSVCTCVYKKVGKQLYTSYAASLEFLGQVHNVAGLTLILKVNKTPFIRTSILVSEKVIYVQCFYSKK